MLNARATREEKKRGRVPFVATRDGGYGRLLMIHKLRRAKPESQPVLRDTGSLCYLY